MFVFQWCSESKHEGLKDTEQFRLAMVLVDV